MDLIVTLSIYIKNNLEYISTCILKQRNTFDKNTTLDIKSHVKLLAIFFFTSSLLNVVLLFIVCLKKKFRSYIINRPRKLLNFDYQYQYHVYPQWCSIPATRDDFRIKRNKLMGKVFERFKIPAFFFNFEISFFYSLFVVDDFSISEFQNFRKKWRK